MNFLCNRERVTMVDAHGVQRKVGAVRESNACQRLRHGVTLHHKKLLASFPLALHILKSSVIIPTSLPVMAALGWCD